ncbi:MAG: hypothetical protein AAF617_04935 [Bacteroidota bacterium]
MKNRYVIFTMLLWSCFQLFSQQKSVEEEYTAYFNLPREALHVHLNKTTFFKGEEIWFKGYAYDQKNQLASKATTNINVGIYDAAGNQVKKALFAAENGVTYGNFAIDSTFTAGTYYVKAETNWMKNFTESNAFIQKIKIITTENLNKDIATTKASFDFQFLPEGGHVVANTVNNIGFKVIDNTGKGISASGILYDADEKQVASFESNTLGMGKFLFHPKKDSQYTAKITLENGATITKEFPKTTAQGISLVLQSLSENDIILDFNTNTTTLQNNLNADYKILIHQNGKLKTIPLQFDGPKKVIRIQKKELFKGINTVTIFDQNKNPILERLFFNDHGIKFTDIYIKKLDTVKDSILLSVNSNNLTKNANLSISVLPEVTESYKPQHTIISNFYLKPHVKGMVENPQYYFENMNRKKKYELDILLLTQGWSRYEWKNIFESKPANTYRFENGIAVSGRVNRPASGVKQLFLHATKNHNSKFIDLDKDQKFEISGVFLEADEELKFSYVSSKGAMKKPGMYLRFLTKNKEDKISEIYLDTTKITKTETADFTVPEDFFYEDAEALETVRLSAEKERRKKYSIFHLLNPTIEEITIDQYKSYDNVVNYLNNRGFFAEQTSEGEVIIKSIIARSGPPVVFLNNSRLLNFNALYNLSLANVERIVIDRYSVAPSIRQTSGVIKIDTRKVSLFNELKTATPYISAAAPTPFAVRKEYYAPNYSSYLNPIFQKYGAISWLPTVELNAETNTTFKIYDTYTKNVTVFIEGIAENGDLISERKTITVR